MASKITTDDGADAVKAVKLALPLHERVLYGFITFTLQYVISAPVMEVRRLKAHFLDKETQPTFTKTYKCRPGLAIRIFFPRSYDRQSSSPQPLPLLFSIHGGGFVIGDPMDNDAWNTLFANQHSALVIALNYAKAPANPFPGPREDLEAIIDAIFRDPELTPYIDPARVGITGFSAGGALALTVSQVPAVRDRITAGVIPIYPVTDHSVSVVDKAATRRYKPALGGTRGAKKDPLQALAPIFDWSYVPVGHDLRDPLLSPMYADRRSLPRRVWLVGCELDLLGHEAWQLACKLAGREVPGLDEPIGQQDLADGGKLGTLVTTGDERFAFEHKDQDGEIKWLCIADAGHGFDMAGQMHADADTVEDGILKRNAVIEMAGKWLFGEK